MPDNRPPFEHLALDLRDDDDLALLARSSRADVAKGSLAALVRRDAPGALDLARELISGHAADQVRAMSAVALGRDPRAESREVLLAALNDPNPVVLRRVAQSLAKIGDEQALRRLGQVQPAADTPEGRDVLASRMLLSYRLGIPEVLVGPPTMTTFSSRRPQEIAFGGRARVPRATILAAAQRELPGVTLSASSVRTFTCSGQPGALVIDSELADRGVGGPRMLGALLRERVCSEKRYSLDAYLLSDDRELSDGKRPRLWLVRPSGRVVHAGHAKMTDGRATFEITESVAPYGNPVKVTGTYHLQSGRLAIEQAYVGKPSVRAARAVTPDSRSAVMRRP